jgi:hypothetical protein
MCSRMKLGTVKLITSIAQWAYCHLQVNLNTVWWSLQVIKLLVTSQVLMRTSMTADGFRDVVPCSLVQILTDVSAKLFVKSVVLGCAEPSASAHTKWSSAQVETVELHPARPGPARGASDTSPKLIFICSPYPTFGLPFIPARMKPDIYNPPWLTLSLTDYYFMRKCQ